MSLKGFHIVFVAASIIMLLGFGFWALGQYRMNSAAGYMVTALFSATAGAGLFLYVLRVNKKIQV